MAYGETYEEFISKFREENKPRTTDDVMTPWPVYCAVRDYVIKKFRIPEDWEILRPFYPGGNFEAVDYSGGKKVVIDNPPFSKLSKILRFYEEREIPFFLFSDGKTVFCRLHSNPNHSVIFGAKILYRQRVDVFSAFEINLLKPYTVCADSTLFEAVKAACPPRAKGARKFYQWPRNVIIFSTLNRIAEHGKYFLIPPDEKEFVYSVGGCTTVGHLLLVSDAIADQIEAIAPPIIRPDAVKVELDPKSAAIVARLNSNHERKKNAT